MPNSHMDPAEAATWEDEAEARAELEYEAHMLGFVSPDDPGFKKAQEQMEEYYENMGRIYDIEEQTGARQCPECGNFSCESRVVEEHRDPTVALICHDPYCGKVTI